jgi:DNA-binding beta-propeller fold protein YncE
MKQLLAVLALLLVACGAPPVNGGPEDGGLDGGGADAGHTEADAGQVPNGLVLALSAPQGPQRGPVLFTVTLQDEQSEGPLFFEWDRGAGLFPARGDLAERALGRAVFAWHSFEDVADDATVTFRVRAPGSGGDKVAQAQVELWNRGDRDRLVLVGHRMRDLPGGGATDDHNEVGLFRFSVSSSALVQTARRLTVGAGPRLARAAPNGRAFVVVEQQAGRFSLLHTPLDADPEGVTVTPSVALPHGSPSDARWSADGRFLYVAGSEGAGQPPTLWRYALGEDWTTPGTPTALATLTGPPSFLDVERTSGRILVACGPGATGRPTVLWLGPDGQELARLVDVVQLPTALAISPRGGVALATSALFGSKVFKLTLGAASLTQTSPTVTTIPSPQDIAFHPSGTSALISNLDRNKVTAVVYPAEGLTAQAEAAGIPLAAEMDMIERGPLEGTAFISSVTRLARVTLDAQGQVTGPVIVADFGTGTSNIIHAVALQR